MAEPDFAPLIAAVRKALRLVEYNEILAEPLHAAQAVLEGLADREWLAQEFANMHPNGPWLVRDTDRRKADALHAALLARTGGDNG